MPCGGDWLMGILSESGTGDEPSPAGVVIVVGGPQYRAGSHRLFVSAARQLAARGVPVLRFDVRGMGDSSGEPRSFEGLGDDIAAAMDGFQGAVPTVKKFVLWGLCDAASAVLLYCDARRDDRLAGLCLLNPWVRDRDTQARTQLKHYYLQRLGQGDFWRKLARGGVAGRAVRDLWQNLRAAARLGNRDATAGERPFQVRMAQGLERCSIPVRLVLSGRDQTAQEFVEAATTRISWKRAIDHAKPDQVWIDEADHTFSSPGGRFGLIAATTEFVQDIASRCTPSSDDGCERAKLH